jgi:putative hydrolase of the HAD superfamily
MTQENSVIKAIFLDIGGVLLTNGWDHHARERAAGHFSLEINELNDRHRIIFDSYESGKMSLTQYLNLLIFYEKRTFTEAAVIEFIIAQSKPFPDMIRFITDLKKSTGIKIVAVNNEGREINEYRIASFGLNKIFDCFVSSCYVHTRKPDQDIYRLATDIANVSLDEVVYVDDRLIFIQAASEFGIRGIHHTSLNSTKEAFEKFGLSVT